MCNKRQKGLPLEIKNIQNHENRRLGLIASLHMQHLTSDRRRRLDEISETVGVSYGTALNTVSKDFNKNKVCTRWIPRLLTDENKLKRVQDFREFLRRWRKDGDRFLNRIIPTDEKWLNFFDPETKRESVVWKTPSLPPPKKARVVKSAKRVMFIFS